MGGAVAEEPGEHGLSRKRELSRELPDRPGDRDCRSRASRKGVRLAIDAKRMARLRDLTPSIGAECKRVAPANRMRRIQCMPKVGFEPTRGKAPPDFESG